MLDLFCGRLGWTKGFLAQGWEVVGIDIVEPPEIPQGFNFQQADILTLNQNLFKLWDFDFVCASSPCEQFSVHGMKHFHPSPPYPELGLKLFHQARVLCGLSGCPYVMENVRAAQQFVGPAVNHCGSFYLWGTGVPPVVPKVGNKGTTQQMAFNPATGKRFVCGPRKYSSGSKARAEEKAKRAVIPFELAVCVAKHAEQLLAR
jgi:C-5 cytosine-specific DNA methylase